MSDERTGEWYTYAEAAERLGVTPEAVRQQAIRGRWQRTRGNDGKARVRVPDARTDAPRTPSERPNANGVRTPSERPNANGVRTPSERVVERVSAERLVAALNDHVETLKRDLAAREADLASVQAKLADAVSSAQSGVASASAEREAMQARLSEMQAVLDAERGKVDAERERADAAIAAHLAFITKVEAARARPWWRRLLAG